MIALIIITLISFGTVTSAHCQIEGVAPDKCFTKENISVVNEYPSSRGRR